MKFFGLKALKAFVLSGIVSGLVVSCQDTNIAGLAEKTNEQATITKVSNSTTVPAKSWETLTIAADKQAINKELIALTKAVAVTVKGTEMQKLLHTKMMEKFDGETEILWSQLNNDRAMTARANGSQAVNWSALVAKSADKSVFSSSEAINTTVARAAKAYNANLHLYWFNAEKWDKTTTPIVAFVPVGCDPEKENIILTGYDASGNKFAVDKEFALKNPVIVINANERTNPDGSVQEGFKPSEANLNASKKGANLQSGVDLGLQWTQFYNESNEGWFNGDPEFWVSIHSINATAPTYTSFEWGRWYCSYSWWRCYGEQYWWWGARRAWWNQDFFKSLRFQWIEQDPGTIIELSIGASYKISNDASVQASGKITTTDQSDILGAATVTVGDPSRNYYTGAPNFGLGFY